MTGQRHALVATAHVRLMMLMLMIAAGFCLVIGRIAMLGLLASPASAQPLDFGSLMRGDILDRNGEPLARTIEAWTIGVHPGFGLLGDRHEVLPRSSPRRCPGMMRLIITASSRCRSASPILSDHASPALVNAVHAIGEPALVFAQEPERLYPQTTLAAHVLGYIGPTGNDPRIIGRSGIERAYDERLSNPAERGTPDHALDRFAGAGGDGERAWPGDAVVQGQGCDRCRA